MSNKETQKSDHIHIPIMPIGRSNRVFDYFFIDCAGQDCLFLVWEQNRTSTIQWLLLIVSPNSHCMCH